MTVLPMRKSALDYMNTEGLHIQPMIGNRPPPLCSLDEPVGHLLCYFSLSLRAS